MLLALLPTFLQREIIQYSCELARSGSVAQICTLLLPVVRCSVTWQLQRVDLSKCKLNIKGFRAWCSSFALARCIIVMPMQLQLVLPLRGYVPIYTTWTTHTPIYMSRPDIVTSATHVMHRDDPFENNIVMASATDVYRNVGMRITWSGQVLGLFVGLTTSNHGPWLSSLRPITLGAYGEASFFYALLRTEMATYGCAPLPPSRCWWVNRSPASHENAVDATPYVVSSDEAPHTYYLDVELRREGNTLGLFLQGHDTPDASFVFGTESRTEALPADMYLAVKPEFMIWPAAISCTPVPCSSLWRGGLLAS